MKLLLLERILYNDFFLQFWHKKPELSNVNKSWVTNSLFHIISTKNVPFKLHNIHHSMSFADTSIRQCKHPLSNTDVIIFNKCNTWKKSSSVLSLPKTIAQNIVTISEWDFVFTILKDVYWSAVNHNVLKEQLKRHGDKAKRGQHSLKKCLSWTH